MVQELLMKMYSKPWLLPYVKVILNPPSRGDSVKRLWSIHCEESLTTSEDIKERVQVRLPQNPSVQTKPNHLGKMYLIVYKPKNSRTMLS